MPTHTKNPSLTSDSGILRKISGTPSLFGPDARPTSPNSVNFNFLSSGPRSSMHELAPDAATFFLSGGFHSPKYSQKKTFKYEGPSQLLDKSSNISGALSPKSPSFGSRNVSTRDKVRKVDRPGRRLVGSDTLKTQEGDTKSSTDVKDNLTFLTKKDSKELSQETNVLEIKNNRSEARESIEKDLQRKDLIIQLYETLVKLCKNQNQNPATMTHQNLNGSVRGTGDSAKGQGDRSKTYDQRNIGSLKARKIVRRGETMGTNNSNSSTLVQKSTQPTLNKTSFLEKIDSKLTLNYADLESVYKEDRQSPAFFKKPPPARKQQKEQKENESLSSVQSRLKKGVLAHLMKRSGKNRQSTSKLVTSGDRVNSPNDSFVKKQDRTYHFGDNIKSLNEEDPEPEDMTNINNTNEKNGIDITEKGIFGGFAERLDNVFSKYHEANIKLLEDIKALAEKIEMIQHSKQRKVE